MKVFAVAGYHTVVCDAFILFIFFVFIFFFLCPRDDSQGALRFVPVCLSVRPFVTLYGIEFV